MNVEPSHGRLSGVRARWSIRKVETRTTTQPMAKSAQRTIRPTELSMLHTVSGIGTHFQYIRNRSRLVINT